MPNSDVEDADPLPYNPSEWIGCEKILPSSVALIPRGLIDHFEACLHVPDNMKQSFPPEDLKVFDFVNFTLPEQTYDLTGLRAQKMFKKRAPNVDGSCLQTQKLPTFKCTESLFKAFRQAVLDGAQSVEDPRFPNSFLPLWSVRFWKEMWRIHQAKERWSSAVDWLKEESAKAAMEGSDDIQKSIAEAQELVRALRWNEDTMISGANRNTTLDFAIFLATSSKMRTTDIDMMFAHLSDRIEREDEFVDRMLAIETLRLWTTLDKAKSQKDYQAAVDSALIPNPRTFLERLENRVKSGELDFVVFPVYMKKQEHWVTMKIDFDNYQLSYGDSLSHRNMPAPDGEIQKVMWWLKKRFSKSFRAIGDVLLHGNQDDVTDCGILCANTAAVEIFESDTVWTPQRKILERVNWFNTLIKKHIDEVSFFNMPGHF